MKTMPFRYEDAISTIEVKPDTTKDFVKAFVIHFAISFSISYGIRKLIERSLA
jgi:hypothetical protein